LPGHSAHHAPRPWLGAVMHGALSPTESGDLRKTMTSGNQTQSTHGTHSRHSPTGVLAVVEDFQALEGSSPLSGFTRTSSISRTPSVGLPTSSSVGGLESRVLVDGSTGTGDAPLARFTGGVERVMISRIGACFAGMSCVAVLLV
jgi:hypothetical protein